MLDMYGCWPSESDQDWTARLVHDWVIQFQSVDPELAVLVEALQTVHGLSSRVGEWEAQRELVRQAGLDELSAGMADRPWNQVMSVMAEQMTRAAVAVPVGGMYSSRIDGRGNAEPLELGGSFVAGRPDSALEASIDHLAKRQGLVGFRFSDASWWTEDLIDSRGGCPDWPGDLGGVRRV